MTEQDAQDNKPLKIMLINAHGRRDTKDFVNYADELGVDLLQINEFFFKPNETDCTNMFVKQNVEAKVAIKQLNNALELKCSFVNEHHIAIKMKKHRILYHGWYIPPSTSPTDSSQTVENLERLLQNGDTKVIHSGDFNAAVRTLGQRGNTRGNSIEDAMLIGHKKFLNEPNVNTFFKCEKSGRRLESITDLTIASEDMINRTNWQCLPPVFGSDHATIMIEIRAAGCAPKELMDKRVVPRIFLNETKTKRTTRVKENWWQEYMEVVEKATKFRCKADKERIPEPLKHLWGEIKRMTKLVRNGHTNESLKRELTDLSAKFRCERVAYEKMERLTRYKKANKETRISELLVSTKTTGKLSKLKDGDQILEADRAVQALMQKFFPHEERIEWELPQDLPNDDLPLRQHEIDSAIKKLTGRKAPGETGVSMELIAQWNRTEPGYLLSLMGDWFSQGVFPDELKSSLIVPLIKDTSKDSTANNVRPVVLTEGLARLYEKVLDVRFMYFLEKSGALVPEQMGYREGMNTLEVIDALQKEREKNKHENMKEWTIQVDVRAAFDSVHHAAVVKAMIESKVPGNIIKIVSSYLTNRNVNIVLEGNRLTKNMLRGVPQGSCLGPHLYLIATTSLLKALKARIAENVTTKTKVFCFADDMFLNISSKKEQDIHSSAEDYLNLIATKLAEVGLSMAPEKTKVMVSGDNTEPKEINLCGNEIITSTSLKALGLIVTSDDTWEDHVKMVETKVDGWMLAQKGLFNPYSGLSVEMRKKVIKTVLTPKITFGARIWWPKLKPAGQTILKRIARKAAIAMTAAPKTAGYDATTLLARDLPVNLVCKDMFQRENWIKDGKIEGKVIERTLNSAQMCHPANRGPRKIDGYIREADQIDSIEASVMYFTDGSQYDHEGTKVTGAAFVKYKAGQEPGVVAMKLDGLNTVFQAEVTAIKAALEDTLANKNDKKVAILSDCLSALMAICDYNCRSELVNDCREWLEECDKCGKKVSLFHVKAHDGIEQNEAADISAKQAAVTGDLEDTPASRATVKRKSKQLCWKEYDLNFKRSRYGREIKNFFADSTDTNLKKVELNPWTAQVYTGHGKNLTSIAYGFQGSPNNCQCGERQTVVHLLTKCKILEANNVACATLAGIKPAEFFVAWEELKNHRHFHRYVRMRAKSLDEDLGKLNINQIILRHVENTIWKFSQTGEFPPD